MSPALGATFTLALGPPSSAIVGQPLVIPASGIDPTDQGTLYLEVDAIPGNVVSVCPSGYEDGAQLAASTGGSFIAFDRRENLDASGHFSSPLGYTPGQTGRLLICGYTDDAATDTLATASLTLNVTSASKTPPGCTSGCSPAPAHPVNLKKPRITRAGNRLTCHPGSWSHSPSGYSYGWLVDGKIKNGAHRQRLSVTRKLRGHKVRCGVTATNAIGKATARSSSFRIR